MVGQDQALVPGQDQPPVPDPDHSGGWSGSGLNLVVGQDQALVVGLDQALVILVRIRPDPGYLSLDPDHTSGWSGSGTGAWSGSGTGGWSGSGTGAWSGSGTGGWSGSGTGGWSGSGTGGPVRSLRWLVRIRHWLVRIRHLVAWSGSGTGGWSGSGTGALVRIRHQCLVGQDQATGGLGPDQALVPEPGSGTWWPDSDQAPGSLDLTSHWWLVNQECLILTNHLAWLVSGSVHLPGLILTRHQVVGPDQAPVPGQDQPPGA